MPARRASAGWRNATSRPSSAIRPLRRVGAGAEQAFQQLGAARAHQAGDAQDFAAPQRKRNVLQPPAPGMARPGERQMLDFEHDVARLRGRDRSVSSISRPTIRCVTARGVGLRRVERLDQPAVAQHGDPIGQAKHLVHLVRDVEDRDAARSQPLDDAEQPGDLRLGQRAGRLVHDEDVGLAATAPWRSRSAADRRRAARRPGSRRIDLAFELAEQLGRRGAPSPPRRAGPSALRSSRPRKMLAAAESCSTRFSSW